MGSHVFFQAEGVFIAPNKFTHFRYEEISAVCRFLCCHNIHYCLLFIFVEMQFVLQAQLAIRQRMVVAFIFLTCSYVFHGHG